jgi:hypothetical protein
MQKKPITCSKNNWIIVMKKHVDVQIWDNHAKI